MRTTRTMAWVGAAALLTVGGTQAAGEAPRGVGYDLPAATTQEVVEGTWTAHRSADGEPRIRLRLWDDDDGWRHETTLTLEDADRVLTGAREGVVDGVLERAAGTLRFQGTVREDGRGRGEFTFREAPGFRADMQALGFRDIDTEEAFAAAVFDVDGTRVRMLRGAGLEPDFDEVLASAIFRIDAPFIQEARSRWPGADLDDLLAMKIHGVTDAWVESLRAEGVALEELDDALAFRIHGVSPAFVARARELDLGPLAEDDLLAMKIHGVDAGAVREARALGLGELDFDDVVAMRIHGVDAAFLRGLAEEGYRLDDVDDAVAFRIHGVTPAWIRELRQDGFRELTRDDLLKMRIHGLDEILRKRGPGR